MITLAKVVIYEEEKQKIINVVRKNENKQLSVAKLAGQAGINPNRARFIFDELVEEGRVEKVIVKKYNDKYIRYNYKVVK